MNILNQMAQNMCSELKEKDLLKFHFNELCKVVLQEGGTYKTETFTLGWKHGKQTPARIVNFLQKK